MWIDPATGAPELTTSSDVASPTNLTLHHLHLRLATQRGTVFWDRSFGSRLHEVVTEKIGASILPMIESTAREALQPMVAAGEITELRVVAARADRNRVELQLSARDAGHRPLRFTYWVEV